MSPAIFGMSMSQMMTSKSKAMTSRRASAPFWAVLTMKLCDSEEALQGIGQQSRRHPPAERS